MEIDIWFPFYYGDYLKDTMQLSAERHGIYLLLMIHCWQNGYIDDDEETISMISKMPIGNKSVMYILDKYFKHENGKYTQSRVTKERKIAEENKVKNVKRAKKAAKARWDNDATSNATSNATSMHQAMHEDMLEECPSPSPSPSQSEDKEHRPEKGECEFDPKVMELYKRRDETEQIINALTASGRGSKKNMFHFKKNIENINAEIAGRENG